MRGRQLYRVDPLDQVEGSIDRTQAHEDLVLHRAGLVFLKRPNGDFMIRRSASAQRGAPSGVDASASFHVEFGDTYSEAAAQELERETGVVAQLAYLGKFRQLDPPENQIIAVFSGASGSQVRAGPVQPVGWDWLSKGEVDKLIATSESTPWMATAWRLVRNRL